MRTHESSASEARLLTSALRDLGRRTRFPVVFGGFVRGGSVPVTTIIGNRTRRLDGLVVRAGRGLGGRALEERRPRLTSDYGSSRLITHDYDGHVLGEGISTLLAVPVIVRGRVRGVLYGGTWATLGVGDVAAAPAVQVADALATELQVREEVERRLATAAPMEPVGLDAAHQEELRASYAELRSIASLVTDAAIRDRLIALEHRLTGLSGGPQPIGDHLPDVRLSPREVDVLARAALGETNAVIAVGLGLREATVKSYLASAMSKLDVSTRIAAIAKARRAGILP